MHTIYIYIYRTNFATFFSQKKKKLLKLKKFAAYPYQIQEIERLKKFAAENGYASKLEYWDVPYWARRQKNAIYKYVS